MKLTLKAIIASISIILIATATILIVVFVDFEPQDEDIDIIEDFDYIRILGDDGFLRYNFPGEGSADNPYSIQGYNLTNPDTGQTARTGIGIRKTTKHFVIANCTLNLFYRGIEIYEIAPGTCKIANNTILEGGWSDSNPAHGIELQDVQGAYIYNNTINSYYQSGICFFWSYDCIVESNYVAYCGYGLVTYGSWDNNMTDNHLEKNGNGIVLWESNTTIISNNFLNNSQNIRCSGKDKNLLGIQILDNTFVNSSSAISISDECYDFIIKDNYFSLNNYGILNHGFNCTIFNNLFYKNDGYGVYCSDTSQFSLIYKNDFIENCLIVGNLSSQAADYGISNIWYNSVILKGNYWSNLGLNSTYTIAGAAGSEDIYPLVAPINLSWLN